MSFYINILDKLLFEDNSQLLLFNFYDTDHLLIL